jgi:Tfp pilus assembly protein PilN
MIEINLSPKEKTLDITNVGGINLSLINVKMIIVSILLLYLPEPYLIDFYKEKVDAIDAQVRDLNKEKRRINVQLREVREIEKQVEVLNAQEGELKKKIGIVESIVAKRQNPFKVLKYIAENTPKDVWFSELIINDRSLEIKGYTSSWKSMTTFFESLKTSIFFSRNVDFQQTQEGKDINGQRVESFSVRANIERFE